MIDRAGKPARVRPHVDGLDAETLRMLQASRRREAGCLSAAAGLAEAWNRFYRACDPMIRALVRHRSGQRSGCSQDDLVQDIWVAVLSDLGQYDPARALRRLVVRGGPSRAL